MKGGGLVHARAAPHFVPEVNGKDSLRGKFTPASRLNAGILADKISPVDRGNSAKSGDGSHISLQAHLGDKSGAQVWARLAPLELFDILRLTIFNSFPAEFVSRGRLHKTNVNVRPKDVFEASFPAETKRVTRKKVATGKGQGTQAKNIEIGPVATFFKQESVSEEIGKTGIGIEIRVFEDA